MIDTDRMVDTNRFVAEAIHRSFLGMQGLDRADQADLVEPSEGDMQLAADVVAALEAAHLLRPEPWPPIPRPWDEAHQARWTMQRAYTLIRWQTGDHNDALIAAAEALIAEGWLPPTDAEPNEHATTAALIELRKIIGGDADMNALWAKITSTPEIITAFRATFPPRDAQLRGRFEALLADLERAYPDPAPFDTASTVIDRIRAALR